jgi:hypothetical protein
MERRKKKKEERVKGTEESNEGVKIMWIIH